MVPVPKDLKDYNDKCRRFSELTTPIPEILNIWQKKKSEVTGSPETTNINCLVWTPMWHFVWNKA